jgi:hypothetical protein
MKDMRNLAACVAGDNGRILYSIGSGDEDGDFSIAQNGTIYTTRLLDRETKSLYNLVVVATDQAKPPQQSLSSTVQVSTEFVFPRLSVWRLATGWSSGPGRGKSSLSSIWIYTSIPFRLVLN